MTKANLHDEELFKQPPPKEDCPICMLPLPSLCRGFKYNSCCGKIICSGCIYAVAIRDKEDKCPFCRTPVPNSDEEMIKQYNKRMEVDNDEAIYNLACCYDDGMHGLPKDHAKALELWHRAAGLGNALAYCNIGVAYHAGNGVERDEKKAEYYYELAAMGGDVVSTYNLGIIEHHARSNWERALKHYMIAVEFGYTRSLEEIKQMFMHGYATKDEYAKALRAYQATLVEIKSAQRDEAAAISDFFKYY